MSLCPPSTLAASSLAWSLLAHTPVTRSATREAVDEYSDKRCTPSARESMVGSRERVRLCKRVAIEVREAVVVDDGAEPRRGRSAR